MSRLRLHVIACAVFQRELEVLAAGTKNALTFHQLDMGLHEGSGESLRTALQNAIDAAPAGACDAIAVAYGLCNRGIIGLQARSMPVVLPRAHDCVGMLLGGTQCYLAQLEAQPNTYFQSAGWLEHLPASGEVRQQMSFGPNATVTRNQLAAKYGEENADYLLDQMLKASGTTNGSYLSPRRCRKRPLGGGGSGNGPETRLEIRATAKRPRLAAPLAQRRME